MNGMAGMPMSSGNITPFYTATVVGSARVDVSVAPATVGQNTIALTLVGNIENRKVVHRFTATKQLTLTATLTQKHIGPLSLPLHRTAPGRYVTAAAVLGAPGLWTLQITDRTSQFEQSQASVFVPIT